MTSNEGSIARLEGVFEGARDEISGMRAEMSDLRGEIRSTRQDLETEIRSTRNTLLMVNLLLWITSIGTLFGLFFGVR